MRPPLRERILWAVGAWLAGIPRVRRLVLRLDAYGELADGRRRYVNRIGGQLVMLQPGERL